MKTAVCSMDRRLAEGIKRFLLNMSGFREIQEFCAIDGLLNAVLHGAAFDYIFLEVDGKAIITGLDFAQDLYQKSPETNLIYITSDGNQLLEEIFLIDANIAGVFKKPLKYERFAEMLNVILSKDPKRKEYKLVFRKKGEMLAIPLKEILYIESKGHMITVYTRAESYVYYGKLGVVTEQLPDNFLQCHKSYLVNMDKIFQIGGDRILLENGQEIPISQARLKASKERYAQYAGKVSEYIIGLEGKK